MITQPENICVEIQASLTRSGLFMESDSDSVNKPERVSEAWISSQIFSGWVIMRTQIKKINFNCQISCGQMGCYNITTCNVIN